MTSFKMPGLCLANSMANNISNVIRDHVGSKRNASMPHHFYPLHQYLFLHWGKKKLICMALLTSRSPIPATIKGRLRDVKMTCSFSEGKVRTSIGFGSQSMKGGKS